MADSLPSMNSLAVPREGESLSPRAFLPDYVIDPASGCWIWQKQKHRGYGLGSFKNVHGINTRWAHRAYYIAANGPLPPGMKIVIDHLCRNPSCVNPAHLEAVVPAENIRRGDTATLTMADAREIRRMLREGLREQDIAPRFGITGFTVWQVGEGITWREDPTKPEPRARKQRGCLSCGVDISAGRRGKKFCSHACRHAYHNARRPKVSAL